jgi:hypothetical protein
MISQDYLLSTSLLKKINTNNFIVDFILSTLLLFFINEIIKNKSFLYDYFIDFLNSYFKYNENYVEIIIESNESTYTDRNGYKNIKTSYSDFFQAISYYIKINKINGIKSKIEPKRSDNTSKSFFDIFIPNQNESFIICPMQKIYCTMNYIKKNINYSEKDNNIIYIHRIIVYSNDININCLEIFLDNLLKIYNKYKHDKSIENQCYFYYDYADDDGETLNYTIKEFFTNKTFNTVFFEEKELYLKQLNFFLNESTWYKTKGIPHHLGILLHGTPGCGKTSIIKATLEYTKRHAFVIPLNRVKTCGELENIFYSNEINDKNIPISKRIYIFEDIDCISDIVFDRKKNNNNSDDEDSSSDEFNDNNKQNKESKKYKNRNFKKESFKLNDKLNLGCLLNILDGIIETPDRIIIMTTNYPEKLDKALLREGRIDINIKLKLFNKSMINELLSSFYELDDKYLINNEKFNNIIDYKISPAQIINICQRNINSIENTLDEILLFN